MRPGGEGEGQGADSGAVPPQHCCAAPEVHGLPAPQLNVAPLERGWGGAECGDTAGGNRQNRVSPDRRNFQPKRKTSFVELFVCSKLRISFLQLQNLYFFVVFISGIFILQ